MVLIFSPPQAMGDGGFIEDPYASGFDLAS